MFLPLWTATPPCIYPFAKRDHNTAQWHLKSTLCLANRVIMKIGQRLNIPLIISPVALTTVNCESVKTPYLVEVLKTRPEGKQK